METFLNFILVSFLFYFCNCSIIDIAKTFPLTADDYQEVIKKILNFYVHNTSSELDCSIFNEIVTYQVSHFDVSEKSLYHNYYKALYIYMNNICQETISKIEKNEPLSHKLRVDVFKKLMITGRDAKFVDNFGIELDYLLDDTIFLMIETWKRINNDNDRKNNPWIAMTLGQYCVSENCQALVYSIIVENFDNPKYVLLPLKINHNIKDTTKYDQYLQNCNNFIPTSDAKEINAKALASTIIVGPDSNIGANILMSILSEDIISLITDYENSHNFTIRFLINTNKAESFLVYLTPELCSKHKSVETFKTKLQLSIYQYNVINSIIAFTKNETFIAGFYTYTTLLRDNQFLLTNYYYIDPKFVRNCIMRLHLNVLSQFSGIEEISDVSEKLFRICMAFFILSTIPTNVYVPELAGTSYESLLDCLISSDLIESASEIPAAIIGYVIFLPYVKITVSCIQKLHDILLKFDQFEKFEAHLRMYVKISLAARYLIEEDVIETFRLFHEFYESHELDFSNEATLVLIYLIERNQYYLARSIYFYAKNNNLLSKVHGQACWMLIRLK